MEQIQKILNRAERAGVNNTREYESLEWFYKKVRATKPKTTPKDFLKEKERDRKVFMAGKMYHFSYFPKYHEKLEYYDLFPLCIPFKLARGGFYGLNLHYIYPKHRLLLFDGMRELEQEKDDGLRFKFTYNLLSSVSKYKWFKPCVKRYLFSHMKSPFMEITQDEWNVAIFLPTEAFVKANNFKVWTDSTKKIEF